MSWHFAVDLGAESGRCVAGEFSDGKITLHELSRFPTGSVRLKDGLYWNIYRFYEEIINGLKLYVQKYGSDLDSIGVDSWGVDYGLINGRGDLIHLPRCYRDSRNDGSIEILNRTMSCEEIYKRTGIQFLTINTLNQLVVSHNEESEEDQNAFGIMFIADLLHYLLGSKACCETTSASISQLFNVEEKDWDSFIFTEFRLNNNIKLPIARTGEKIGVLSPSIAKEVGLNNGTAIITPATHDTASAGAAVPAKGENWGYISSGTWSLVGVELENPIINDQSFKLNISNSGAAFNKVLFLKNVMGLWIIQQCRSQWLKNTPDLDYARIAKLAKFEIDTDSRFFIDPDDHRFLSPGNMPQKICDYIFEKQRIQIDSNNIGLLASIVFKSLAMKYRYVMETICDTTSKKLNCLHIVGGGSKNDLLNQLTSNIMQIPVMAGPTECSVMGNLLLQAYGCHLIDSHDELRYIVRNSTELINYMPEKSEIWNDLYNEFLNVTHLA